MNIGETDRLFKLQTRANELLLAGQRDADPLLEFLQQFVFGKDLGFDLWSETHKALGLEAEFRQGANGLILPDNKKLWYLPMVKGVTSNKIVAGCRSLGVKYSLYDEDLDNAVPTHKRDANRDGSYIVGFRRNVEADEEFADKSANMLAEVDHQGICLPERLMLGAGYYVATGQHLDTRTWTLCAGSRSSGGRVPGVGWYPERREVYVRWDYPDGSSGRLRSRSVEFLSLAQSRQSGT